MDYSREANNADRFRADMSEHGIQGVLVPQVFRGLSNDVVLTTQWVEGRADKHEAVLSCINCLANMKLSWSCINCLANIML